MRAITNGRIETILTGGATFAGIGVAEDILMAAFALQTTRALAEEVVHQVGAGTSVEAGVGSAWIVVHLAPGSGEAAAALTHEVLLAQWEARASVLAGAAAAHSCNKRIGSHQCTYAQLLKQALAFNTEANANRSTRSIYTDLEICIS